jgi:flagellar hook protein FlgE
MSFQQGLSGLSGAQRALDATSNNVANAATVGFKQSGAQFADIFAASLNGASGQQVGIGTMVGQVAQQFSQGNITTTNNALDVAINGSGFYRMSNNGTITYTRNGQFSVDKDGYVVNAQGLHLTGYGVDTVGTIVQGAPSDLRIQTTDIAPNTTTTSNLVLNLDSRKGTPSAMMPASIAGSASATTAITAANNTLNVTVDGTSATATIPVLTAPATYTFASLAAAVETAINSALPAGTSVDVNIDSSGNMTLSSGSAGSGSTITASGSAYAALMGASPTTTAGTDNFSISNPSSYTSSTSQTVFDSKGNAHTFSMYFAKTAADGQWQLYTSLDGGAPTGATNLAFNTYGQLATAMPLSQSFTLSNGANSPLAFTLDFTGSTEYGNTFGVSQMLQDGYTSGRLSGISISPEGVLQGNYSNGETTNLGQIVLANFANPNGLISLGGNQWSESFASGQPIVGVPGSGSLGVVQAAAVEEANIDLTAEMVNMITEQRNYQANAQSIKTQDQLMQTLVNLR